MVRYIDENRNPGSGVEPICRTLEVAPSTYYAAKGRPPSARAIADEELKANILEVYQENYGVYGAERIWRALRRKGIEPGRDRVARLMADLGIAGGRARERSPAPPSRVGSHKAPLTWSNESSPQPLPTASGWPGLTYVPTWSGFVYVAFIVDVYSP